MDGEYIMRLIDADKAKAELLRKELLKNIQDVLTYRK